MTTLNEAYEALEHRSLEEKHTHTLSDIFKDVRDDLYKNNQKFEAVKAQYEIDFLNFNIHENNLSFLYSGTNSKGELVQYPSLKQFTDDEYKYLIERWHKAKSPALKSRYSHILWLSPKKKIEHAHTAIKEYLKLIRIIEKQDQNQPEDYFGLRVLDNIKNAFLLSISINYEIEKVKKELLRIVKKYSFESTSAYVIRMDLIEIMLKHKTIFNKVDFKGIVSVCEKIFQKKYAESRHAAIDVLSLIIKVEKKLGNNVIDYERRIGELWEKLVIEREDDTNIVSTEFCIDAIKQYKKIKDTKKVKELEQKLNELKKRIRLGSFGQEIDLTESVKEYRKFADNLSNNSSVAIINYLMTDKNLLPTYEEMEKQTEGLRKEFFFSQMFGTSVLDNNGNTVQYFSDEDEKKYFEILQCYQFSLDISRGRLIAEIFFACIKKKKLTAQSILDFLKSHSWLGKELQMKSNDGKYRQYCWLALIAPALNEYFVNLEIYYRNAAVFPNFVLCIDSLVLKIEGMLRDICTFNQITTYELKTDKKGRTISHEKDIHKLLYEEEINKLIDKDDLLFFKFLLVEKVGYNLRHKVAHSLMTYNEYHIHYMNLLVIAILKLENMILS